ncbi:MAG: hypothetical protein KKF44_03800 [Nanoarchaeota archaeon]|nr:hypothetical protein [Nanoarchaeota archaeon]
MIIKDKIEFLKSRLTVNPEYANLEKAMIEEGWTTEDIKDTYDFIKIGAEAESAGTESRYVGMHNKVKTERTAYIGIILSIFLWPIGLLVSIYALNKINNDEYLKGEKIALAGIIISAMELIYWLIVIFTGVGSGFLYSIGMLS